MSSGMSSGMPFVLLEDVNTLERPTKIDSIEIIPVGGEADRVKSKHIRSMNSDSNTPLLEMVGISIVSNVNRRRRIFSVWFRGQKAFGLRHPEDP